MPQEEPVEATGTSTVWRSSELPTPQTARASVPLSEGITSVFLGAVLYIPVALVTGYASWNYLVALVLVVALSYALCSRRVVAGPGFVAVRKFGPYRVAQADAVRSGAIKQTQRGGVLTVRTGDGRTMRLRRVEYSKPDVASGGPGNETAGIRTSRQLRRTPLRAGRRREGDAFTSRELRVRHSAPGCLPAACGANGPLPEPPGGLSFDGLAV